MPNKLHHIWWSAIQLEPIAGCCRYVPFHRGLQVSIDGHPGDSDVNLETFVLFLSHTPARFYLSVELGFIVCFLHFMHICHARHYSTLRNVHYRKRRRRRSRRRKEEGHAVDDAALMNVFKCFSITLQRLSRTHRLHLRMFASKYLCNSFINQRTNTIAA